MDVAAYLPRELASLVVLGGGLLAIVVVGFVVARIPVVPVARAAAWSLALSGVFAAHRWTIEEPGGYRMVAIILALLFAMKAVVQVEAVQAGRRPLGVFPYVAFATLWFGMQPRTFEAFPGPPRRGIRPLVRKAVVAGIAGTVLVAGAAWVRGGGPAAGSENVREVVALVLLLPGLSLLLHFGLFNAVAGGLRALGADTYALFREPLRSTSLEAFWSRRWNRGFSEMTSLAVHRPLSNIVGARVASVIAFLFSGLLHELAISVPVQSGYGLPMAYFGIHAALMQIEAWPKVRRFFDTHRSWSRAWVIAALVLPLPILFHAPFLDACIWPVIGQ